MSPLIDLNCLILIFITGKIALKILKSIQHRSFSRKPAFSNLSKVSKFQELESILSHQRNIISFSDPFFSEHVPHMRKNLTSYGYTVEPSQFSEKKPKRDRYQQIVYPCLQISSINLLKKTLIIVASPFLQNKLLMSE